MKITNSNLFQAIVELMCPTLGISHWHLVPIGKSLLCDTHPIKEQTLLLGQNMLAGFSTTEYNIIELIAVRALKAKNISIIYGTHSMQVSETLLEGSMQMQVSAKIFDGGYMLELQYIIF